MWIIFLYYVFVRCKNCTAPIHSWHFWFCSLSVFFVKTFSSKAFLFDRCINFSCLFYYWISFIRDLTYLWKCRCFLNFVDFDEVGFTIEAKWVIKLFGFEVHFTGPFQEKYTYNWWCPCTEILCVLLKIRVNSVQY